MLYIVYTNKKKREKLYEGYSVRVAWQVSKENQKATIIIKESKYQDKFGNAIAFNGTVLWEEIGSYDYDGFRQYLIDREILVKGGKK